MVNILSLLHEFRYLTFCIAITAWGPVFSRNVWNKDSKKQVLLAQDLLDKGVIAAGRDEELTWMKTLDYFGFKPGSILLSMKLLQSYLINTAWLSEAEKWLGKVQDRVLKVGQKNKKTWWKLRKKKKFRILPNAAAAKLVLNWTRGLF